MTIETKFKKGDTVLVFANQEVKCLTVAAIQITGAAPQDVRRLR